MPNLTVTATGANLVDRLRDNSGSASAEKIDLCSNGKWIDKAVKVWLLCHYNESLQFNAVATRKYQLSGYWSSGELGLVVKEAVIPDDEAEQFGRAPSEFSNKWRHGMITSLEEVQTTARHAGNSDAEVIDIVFKLRP
jgi:hypothetical protein